MKSLSAAFLALVAMSPCVADQTDMPLPQSAQQRAARPRQAAPVVPQAPAGGAAAVAGAVTAPMQDPAADAPKFTSEAKWTLAGYNNNEVVYTIIVTSQDARILRCTTEMQGFYIDNGAKQTVSDRQVTTLLPNEPTQVGNWMNMDQPSGANYSVKCKRA